jgi:hypothetical protein
VTPQCLSPTHTCTLCSVIHRLQVAAYCYNGGIQYKLWKTAAVFAVQHM